MILVALGAGCTGGGGRTVAPIGGGRLPAIQLSSGPGTEALATAASAIRADRFVRAVTADGGALRIGPAPRGFTPIFPMAKAATVVHSALTYDPGTYEPTAIGLGVVSLASSLTKRLGSYRSRLAWAAVIGPQAAISCPSVGAHAAFSPSFKLVIMDARSGRASLVYRSRGTGPCGGPVTGPVVSRAMEIVSIPWSAVGDGPPTSIPMPPGTPSLAHAVDWVIRYTVPPCGVVFDSPGTYLSDPNHPDVFIDVQIPIDPPNSCPGAKTMTTSFGPERVSITKVLHAPLGVTSPQ